MKRTPGLRAQLLLKPALGIVLFVVSAFVLTSLITGRPRSEPRRQQKERLSLSATETKADSKPASESLAQLIENAIAGGKLASARWGISVISLDGEHSVYERNANSLFVPASNMKLYTTAVASDLLGADYRWRTSVYAGAQPDATGTIVGDLVLYGRGAPDLVAQTGQDGAGSLAQLADALYNRGIRQVSGNVIGDDSYFRGESLGDGWQWTDVQWYFGAEASALSINSNEIDVSILPPNKAGASPQVSVHPADDFVSVQNNMTMVKRGERMTIGIHRGLSDNVVRVWGEFPVEGKGYGVRLSVHNPALWAARLFQSALRARGITVGGVAEARDSRRPQGERFDPSAFTELAFVSSRPFSEIVKATNKASINLNAELILRTLGRERGSMLSGPEPPGRERGDEEAGLSLIRLWMSRAGISTEGLAFHDGSGLSRLNLVTPESISRLLVALSKTSAGPVFRQSLPVSGRDGTLGGRLGKVADQVSAKTGSLTYDTSLSGYITAADGRHLAFSILCNDHTTPGSAARVIDQIVTILAAYPLPGS
jgi:D-alanyl-D-alanine carboxypeptidase/D-alanyl-D-alanine-endopeptidase (penicillin-binding protein 4)